MLRNIRAVVKRQVMPAYEVSILGADLLSPYDKTLKFMAVGAPRDAMPMAARNIGHLETRELLHHVHLNEVDAIFNGPPVILKSLSGKWQGDPLTRDPLSAFSAF